MSNMKTVLLTILRNKDTNRATFRNAAQLLFQLLATEVAEFLETRHTIIQTPLEETDGKELSSTIVFVPVLRSGITMLPAFLQYFPDAAVGAIGARRDEQTADPMIYYQNLPSLDGSEYFIVLDPMLATGGTMAAVLQILTEAGAKEDRIIAVGVVCAPEGRRKIQRLFPQVIMHIAATDECLSNNFFILPGLGDFGDRYFGTE